MLIRDRLDLQALTPCLGQGSVSLISLTQTDTRHATTFLLALSVWREQLLLSLNPKPLGTQQLVRIKFHCSHSIISIEELVAAIPSNALTLVCVSLQYHHYQAGVLAKTRLERNNERMERKFRGSDRDSILSLAWDRLG